MEIWKKEGQLQSSEQKGEQDTSEAAKSYEDSAGHGKEFQFYSLTVKESVVGFKWGKITLSFMFEKDHLDCW